MEENEEDRVQEAEDDMVDQAIALSRAESCESYDSGLQQAIRLSQAENKAKSESYESDDRALQKARTPQLVCILCTLKTKPNVRSILVINRSLNLS